MSGRAAFKVQHTQTSIWGTEFENLNYVTCRRKYMRVSPIKIGQDYLDEKDTLFRYFFL